MFPDGWVPPEDELSDAELCARVHRHFGGDRTGLGIPGRKSILRAAGRLLRGR